MIENATKWYKIRHGLDGWDQERYYAAADDWTPF